jgi:hypothetical protein
MIANSMLTRYVFNRNVFLLFCYVEIICPTRLYNNLLTKVSMIGTSHSFEGLAKIKVVMFMFSVKENTNTTARRLIIENVVFARCQTGQ